jgi:hypothetical protein
VLEGSSDGSSWSTLDSQTDYAFDNASDVVMFDIASPVSYAYYRIYITANNGNAYTGLQNFQLYVAR